MAERIIAFTALSNGLDPAFREKMNQMKNLLQDQNIQVKEGDYLYKKDSLYSGSPQERAGDLNHFFTDSSTDFIFDLSGGDIANETLPYLDYEKIGKSRAVFAGYSDLTPVINAIYHQTGKASMLYQIRHILSSDGNLQQRLLGDFI